MVLRWESLGLRMVRQVVKMIWDCRASVALGGCCAALDRGVAR